MGVSSQLIIRQNPNSNADTALVNAVCLEAQMQEKHSRSSSCSPLLQVPRTSRLDAPIMQLTGKMHMKSDLGSQANNDLTGHSAEVYSVQFDPKGQHIASGSFDRTIRTLSPSISRSCKCIFTDHPILLYSPLECVRRVQELWDSDWPQWPYYRPKMVARLENPIFCVGGHDNRQLGCGDWPKGPHPHWA